MRFLRFLFIAVVTATGLTAVAASPASASITIVDAPEEWTYATPILVVATVPEGTGSFTSQVDGAGPIQPAVSVAEYEGQHFVYLAGIRDPGDHTVTIRAQGAAGESFETSFAVTVYSQIFSDVPDNHVFVGEMQWLAWFGITTGYDNGDGSVSFRPDQPVLREQMAAFLYRLEFAITGEEPAVELPAASPFTDVSTSHAFYREMVWLANTGITTGYDNGNGTVSFRPGQPVLREQMAAFLCRFATGSSCANETPGLPQIFTDVLPSHVFFEAIDTIEYWGITTGYDNGDGTRRYAPSEPVLREQMAAFLYRYANSA